MFDNRNLWIREDDLGYKVDYNSMQFAATVDKILVHEQAER